MAIPVMAVPASFGRIAHLVERSVHIRKVVGSNPAPPTIFFRILSYPVQYMGEGESHE